MAEKEPNYVTPYKYAQLCGVSATAINNRIKRGQLRAVELKNPIDGSVKRYIDLEANPVTDTIAALRPYPTNPKQGNKK